MSLDGQPNGAHLVDVMAALAAEEAERNVLPLALRTDLPQNVAALRHGLTLAALAQSRQGGLALLIRHTRGVRLW